jgi:hypothetical protein
LIGGYSRTRLAAAAALVVAGAVTWTLPSVLVLAISSVLLGLLAARVTLEAYGMEIPEA